MDCGVCLAQTKLVCQVFGRPSQIMGGLFKFIDGVNNENCEGGKRGDAALIVAHVNEVGDHIGW